MKYVCFIRFFLTPIKAYDYLQQLQESPMSEMSFEQVDEVGTPEKVDDDRSLVSGVTECKSNAVEQEYDIIPGNDSFADGDSVVDLDEQGKLHLNFMSFIESWIARALSVKPIITNPKILIFLRLIIRLHCFTSGCGRNYDGFD